MKSRYDFMEDSKVCDIDGVNYPDPLSLNYSDYAITEIPTLFQTTAADISKFWTRMYHDYKITELDDVLLDMNGIGYVGMLEPGSILYRFDIKDIQGVNSNKRKEVI